MRVPALRAALALRGVSSDGLLEKDELVARLLAVWSLLPSSPGAPSADGAAHSAAPASSSIAKGSPGESLGDAPQLRRCHRPSVNEGLALLSLSASARLWSIVLLDPSGARDAEVGALVAQGADPCARFGAQLVPLAAASLQMACKTKTRSKAMEDHLRVALTHVMNRWTALLVACFHGTERSVAAMLSAPGVDVDVHAPGGYDAYLPLRVAVQAGHVGVVKLLLAHGASPCAVELDLVKAALPSPRARLLLKLLQACAHRVAPDLVKPPGEPKLSEDDMAELSTCCGKQIDVACNGVKESVRPKDEGFNVSMAQGCTVCGAHKPPPDFDFLRIDGHTLRASLSVCSRCERTYYCSRACQISHWPAHSECCTPPRDKAAPVNISVFDLGVTPPQSVIDAAVAEFHALTRRGLFGDSNPVPSFIDVHGKRVFC